MNPRPLPLRPDHCRRPRRLQRIAFALLALLVLARPAAQAAEPAAEQARTPASPPLVIDPPKLRTQLPKVALRAPQADSVAAATYPALQQAFAAGRLDDARALAATAVDATTRSHGERDPRSVDARLNRAVVSLESGEVQLTGEQFTAVIDEASAIGGLRAPQLETAWYGLGTSLLAAGNPADAERAFAAALQQRRINAGLHTQDQVGYLDAMTLTARSRSRLDLADGFQLRRIELAERLYGDASIERAEAAQVLADWYSSTSRPREALQVQAYRLDILSRVFGRDDIRLVPALLDEALAYAVVVDNLRERPVTIQTRNGTVLQSTEQPLNQALRLIRKHEPQLSALERGQMLIRVGDVHWVQGDRKRAVLAWQQARTIDASSARRLAQPEPLEWPGDWPQQAGIDAVGRLEVAFTVTDRGRVADIAVVEQAPAGDAAGKALATTLRRLLGRMSFRPALGQERSESRADVRYRHLFRPSS
ncbi:MAG: hypothetical protein NTW01_02200 [Gammaproteobacteria bacterium]|nr:hypothetical protein [Gammaproteobacteria bacterium]